MSMLPAKEIKPQVHFDPNRSIAYTIKEVYEMFDKKVSIRTLQDQCEEGRIKAVFIGKWLISASWVSQQMNILL